MFITQLFNTRGLRDFYATCMTSSKLCWKPPCTARELILNHGFLPCKNSAPDPWSNRRHSPRQHGNFHDIFTGNLHQKHQKIMCSSRVFVCWVWFIFQLLRSIERRGLICSWQTISCVCVQYFYWSHVQHSVNSLGPFEFLY